VLAETIPPSCDAVLSLSRSLFLSLSLSLSLSLFSNNISSSLLYLCIYNVIAQVSIRFSLEMSISVCSCLIFTSLFSCIFDGKSLSRQTINSLIFSFPSRWSLSFSLFLSFFFFLASDRWKIPRKEFRSEKRNVPAEPCHDIWREFFHREQRESSDNLDISLGDLNRLRLYSLRLYLSIIPSTIYFDDFILPIFISQNRYDMCRRRKGGRCTKGTAGMVYYIAITL